MSKRTLEIIRVVTGTAGLLVLAAHYITHNRTLLGVFFVWMTLPMALLAQLANIKRKEEDTEQSTALERATGYATPVFFVILSAGSLTLGILVFCGVL